MTEIQHFGIKGMKWGVRRPEGSDGRVKSSPVGPSDDAARAAEAKTKATTHGVQTLSNKELQDVITRDNLMQQYSRLNPRAKTRGEKVVDGIQTTVKYAQQAQQMYNSPVGKMLREELKKAKK